MCLISVPRRPTLRRRRNMTPFLLPRRSRARSGLRSRSPRVPSGLLLPTPPPGPMSVYVCLYVCMWWDCLGHEGAAHHTHRTLHYTTLHYTTLHYTTLYYPTLHYTTLHYTTLHYTTLHYTTLHYTTLHYTTLHYTTPTPTHTHTHTHTPTMHVVGLPRS